MAKDDSVVKSFRTTEEQFNQANEIFRKEGFSFSEVIRLLFDATIREGHIPRGLSTRDMEEQMDAAQHRENYISSVLDKAVPDFEEYEPWKRDKGKYRCEGQMSIFDYPGIIPEQ